MKRSQDIRRMEQVLSEAKPFLILAPPRSSSTALGRAMLNHSQIGPYIHEPCDLYRHQSAPPASIVDRLLEGNVGVGAIVKEMTFQLGGGDVCRSFLKNVHHPIVILIRDPRLTLESRLRMVLGDLASTADIPLPYAEHINVAIESKNYRPISEILTEERFPTSYTGWASLEWQLVFLRSDSIPYLLLDAGDYRRSPRPFLETICRSWNLEFEDGMLNWSNSDGLQLGELDEQGNWYTRVSESKSVVPETSTDFLTPDRLPDRFAAHLPEALAIYEEALNDPNRIQS